MVYESSYESGRKPFQPDTTRGYWTNPNDFIFLCLGLAFKLDFFFTPMIFFIRMGIFAFVPYLICLGLYTVPIMVIQSFMGQFSSSGFISAFRVSPIFKGMGYISLALNFATLTYYSVFATVPMIFFFNSMKPTLPWSCEIFEVPEKYWNVSEEIKITICNASDVERIRAEEDIKNDTQITFELPSTIFFKSYLPGIDNESWASVELHFSWELFLCTVLLWSAIAALFFKYFNTPKLGEILRYAIWTALSLLTICIIRFIFLPGAVDSLSHYVLPKADDLFMGIEHIFVYSIVAFGPGWGSVITLSSFNKFNRNIMRDSWIICLGQMLIFTSFNISAMLINWHFSEITSKGYRNYIHSHWDIYVSTASAISNMRFANFWSLLFYGMLILAAFIVMTTQIYSLLVSIFDEFENLRAHKTKVSIILIGILALLSIYLCTNEGIFFFSALSIDTLFTQTALNLLLLLVILWIYGRERFQRDIEFMLSQPFPTWKVNMLRFVAPICLILILMWSIFIAIFEHMFSGVYVAIMGIIFILLPWISIPAYGLYMTIQTLGPWRMRIQRSCRPTDWYPVEQEDRQRYEEAMGNENITHQLSELREEVL